jgi:hypothetical protein
VIIGVQRQYLPSDVSIRTSRSFVDEELKPFNRTLKSTKGTSDIGMGGGFDLEIACQDVDALVQWESGEMFRSDIGELP